MKFDAFLLKKIGVLSVFFVVYGRACAQTQNLHIVNYDKQKYNSEKQWFIVPPSQSGYPGINLDNLNTISASHNNKKTIIAVIDAGLQVDHNNFKKIIYLIFNIISNNENNLYRKKLYRSYQRIVK